MYKRIKFPIGSSQAYKDQTLDPRSKIRSSNMVVTRHGTSRMNVLTFKRRKPGVITPK